MDFININGKTYGYAVNYKDNAALRSSFNSLMSKTFGFHLEELYQNGYWQDRYIPYSILDGNTVVANVSINVMDFYEAGEKRRYIQIGTVMTEKEYRNQGLSRFLMEKVLEEWSGRCDLIYLFANNSVLDFYPKFGFAIANEYQHSRAVCSESSAPDIVKLNMSDKKDMDLLYNIAGKTTHFSQLAMQDGTYLVMFYCTSFMSQDIYYIRALDAIVIAEYSDDILYLNDIFCMHDIPLDDIISSMAKKETKKVILGFTPKDTTSFQDSLLKQEGSTLFILEDKFDVFNHRKIMFPVLSHA